jgi:hypothetical protein
MLYNKVDTGKLQQVTDIDRHHDASQNGSTVKVTTATSLPHKEMYSHFILSHFYFLSYRCNSNAGRVPLSFYLASFLGGAGPSERN